MPEIDKRLLALRFGLRADAYENVTPVQSDMRAALVARVQALLRNRPVSRILEMGCGTGQLTELLRVCFPAAHITALDISPPMIAAARAKRLQAHFEAADAEEYVRRESGPYDLVISNAAVQWFLDPRGTLDHCRRMLNPAGVLAVATFGEKTFRELRSAFDAAYAEAGRPPEPHVLTLPPLSFWQEQFPGAEIREDLRVCWFPGVRAFLESVQEAGAAYAAGDRRPIPRGVLKAMFRLYAERFPADGGSGVQATYHIVHIYCAG